MTDHQEYVKIIAMTEDSKHPQKEYVSTLWSQAINSLSGDQIKILKNAAEPFNFIADSEERARRHLYPLYGELANRRDQAQTAARMAEILFKSLKSGDPDCRGVFANWQKSKSEAEDFARDAARSHLDHDENALREYMAEHDDQPEIPPTFKNWQTVVTNCHALLRRGVVQVVMPDRLDRFNAGELSDHLEKILAKTPSVKDAPAQPVELVGRMSEAYGHTNSAVESPDGIRQARRELAEILARIDADPQSSQLASQMYPEKYLANIRNMASKNPPNRPNSSEPGL